MGFFFKSNKEEADRQTKTAINPSVSVHTPGAPDIHPAIVAAIVAAVCETMGTQKLAVNIRQTNSMWAVAGRQKLMDVRQNLLMKS